MFELVAAAGIRVDDEVTPREAFWMARHNEWRAWNHTSALLCGVFNLVSKKPLSPTDFHPLEASDAKEATSDCGAREFFRKARMFCKKG